MCVPAHDEFLADAVENRPEFVSRRKVGEYLGVVARRGVAEKHIPDAVGVEFQRHPPSSDFPSMILEKLVARPANDLVKRFWDMVNVSARPLREHVTFAVTPDEASWDSQTVQARHAFSRHRARQHITPNNNHIDVRTSDLVNDRFKGRKIAMYVIKGSNSRAHDKGTQLDE